MNASNSENKIQTKALDKAEEILSKYSTLLEFANIFLTTIIALIALFFSSYLTFESNKQASDSKKIESLTTFYSLLDTANTQATTSLASALLISFHPEKSNYRYSYNLATSELKSSVNKLKAYNNILKCNIPALTSFENIVDVLNKPNVTANQEIINQLKKIQLSIDISIIECP